MRGIRGRTRTTLTTYRRPCNLRTGTRHGRIPWRTTSRTHGIHDKQLLVPWRWTEEEKLSPGSLHDVLYRHIMESGLSGRRISREREIDGGRSVAREPVSELESLFHSARSIRGCQFLVCLYFVEEEKEGKKERR